MNASIINVEKICSTDEYLVMIMEKLSWRKIQQKFNSESDEQ